MSDVKIINKAGRNFLIKIGRHNYQVVYKRVKHTRYIDGYAMAFQEKSTGNGRSFSSGYTYSEAKNKFITEFLKTIKLA